LKFKPAAANCVAIALATTMKNAIAIHAPKESLLGPTLFGRS
jgi:hypothetical protein